MKRSWLLYIALGVAIFFAITYAIFFYWNIDNNNKWSTFFSFTSTFGIVATIVVYWLGKADLDKKEKRSNKINLKSISTRLNHQIKINTHITEQLKSLCENIINNGEYLDIKFHITNNFLLVVTRDKRLDLIWKNPYEPFSIIEISPKELEAIYKDLTILPNNKLLIDLFSEFIIDAYDILYDSTLLIEKITSEYKVDSLYSTVINLNNACDSFLERQEEIKDNLSKLPLH
ncbi:MULTISPECIES: hypothetical protein [Providencia]|uniref:hypothetical protein n=1 Tax=Providencia TaxID=586 RepID=UPI00109C4C26|nr:MULTISPECIES: hypothetical protein [Providencia]ELR5208419.1 hypothetical protein [Providencia rettgeri]QQE94414.1 hypothetical protein JFB93_06155 [Providencia rettgeri]QWJ92879.1 hypothetical protein KM147_06200 [Providencia rettgeri]THB28065.1 hypothetical protein E6R27_06895 [Providencia sp. MGF014]WOC05425.1 hypothetical protein P3L56_06525 [Providencia sp. PROV024]